MHLYEHIKDIVQSGQEPDSASSARILNILDDEINQAQQHSDKECSLSLNRTLYLLYKLYYCTTNYQGDVLEQSVFIFQLRVKLEGYLQKCADEQISNELLENIPQANDDYFQYLNHVIENHAAYAHYIYERFIPYECDLQQLRYYFVQETTMDVNTDDFLALLQLGCEKSVKTEIARNYWDEMGHGKYEKMHCLLFENLFDYLGIKPDIAIEDITLEALVCGNLQLFVSLYRRYFAYGAGFFYPCEYMASGRFGKAIQAWERLDLNQKGLVYHKLHVPLDVIHAERWMDNVLVPYVNLHPQRKHEVLKGCLYRLNSSLNYLNQLQSYWGLGDSAPLMAQGG